MIRRLRITVLADNTTSAPDLLAEHGLSMLIEADDRRILFDTGQGRVLLGNMEALGTRLSALDAVVLSHGHYDHTGGLSTALQQGDPAAIFLHPAAVKPKYAKREVPPHRSIGIPRPSLEALNAVHERIVWTRSSAEIVPGVWCTGEIPRAHSAEATEGYFFLDAECREADPLLDDQALVVETSHGLVVIAGCAHSGVMNMLDQVCNVAGRDEVFALLGGLHLGRAPYEQLEAVGNSAGRRDIQILAPCHCTGAGAQAYLRGRFHSRVRDIGAGSRLTITA
jgi:7,8-dihydropterin-6-yl-methyl-4-(beta-D-ribofuranosyl)aminobenzene 5'-phosphate synthase